MSKGFSISLSGLQPTLKKLKDQQDAVIKDLDEEFSASTQLMALSAKQNAPFFEGVMKNSIGAERVGELEYDVFCNAMYAPFVEFGTKTYVQVPADLKDYASQFRGKKGKGGFEQFKKSIIKWAKKKGFDKNMANYLVWIISTRGIKPQPFFFPAIKAQRKTLINNLIKVIRDKRG